jgi:hypothetical protein
VVRAVDGDDDDSRPDDDDKSTRSRYETYSRGHRQLAEFVWRYGHGWIGRVGLRSLCQAAVAVPVTWFQVVNRSAISRRYSSAASRWWPGRKCGDIR